MLEQISVLGTLILAGWIVAVGGLMALAPEWALILLRQAGSSMFAHALELLVRFAFGLALMGASTRSFFPDILMAIGAFMAVTSLLILVAPRGWHAAYALWWSSHLPPWLVRLLSILAFIAAILLLLAMQVLPCESNPYCE